MKLLEVCTVLSTFLLVGIVGFGVQFTHPEGILRLVRFNGKGVSYEGNVLFKVHVPTSMEALRLRRIQQYFNRISDDTEFDPKLRVDIWPDHEITEGDNLIRVPREIVHDFETMLHRKGLQYEIVLSNLQEAINTEAETNQLRADADFFSTYRTYEDIQAFIRDLAATYPSIAKTFHVGETFEGRNITGLHISGSSPITKPGFFFMGGQHAREWIAPMTVAYIMNTLVTQYGVNSDITSIVDGVDFYIVPLVNPDGYVYTQTDRMWRKNRSRDRTACYGVDNNRNWGYQWNTGGSSGVSCSETYHGPSPFSENENVGIANFISSKPNIKAFIDFHSYGQLFMNPWGWTDDVTPDNEIQQQVSSGAAQAMKAVHKKEYEVGTDTSLTYIASGGSDDWTYGEVGVTYSYTVELRDTGQFGFLLPAQEIVPQGEEAFAGVQYIAQYLISL